MDTGVSLIWDIQFLKRTYAEYLKRYKEDPKLPSGPLLHYQKKWSELSRIAN